MSYKAERDILRQQMWDLLCNRGEDYVPAQKALAFLCVCEPRNANVNNLQALAQIMYVDLWTAACELEGVSSVPELHKHYRHADGACSVELLWQEARRLGLSHALDLIREAEIVRRDRGLSFFGGAISAIVGEVADASAVETVEARQDRRLLWLREQGGDHDGSGVKGGRGLKAELSRLERAAGRPMWQDKEIGADLAAAVARERGGRDAHDPFGSASSRKLP